MHIGPATASYAFYLPNPPLMPEYWHWEQDNSIAELIALNGNHWRKIFTIMAKICAPVRIGATIATTYYSKNTKCS